MARIVFTLEDYSEIEAELDADVTTFGRNEGNLVILPSGSVSGNHATVTKRGDEYFVQDLGSTNGTRLNGATVEVSKLDDGDFLSFGDIRGVVHLDVVVAPLPADTYDAPVLSSVAALEALSKPRKTTGPVSPAAAVAPLPVHHATSHRPIVDNDPFRPISLVKVALALCATFVIGLHLRHFAENEQILVVDYVKKLVAGEYGQVKGVTKPKNG